MTTWFFRARIRHAASIGVLLMLLPIGRLVAQAPAPKLGAKERASALQAIERSIDSIYVFPELRPKIIARLEQSRRSHRYDVSDAALFAQRITEDLDAAAHDGHLYLMNDPEQYAALSAPPESSNGLDAYREAIATRNHSGLTKLEILPGNIRYLRLEHFQWIPGATQVAYDDAGRFLKDGDAVIIDLRGNGGGSSDAADYFSKTFLPPDRDPVRALLPQSRERDPRWQGKPLYLLVDGGVVSAAEAVSYGAQQEKTAIIVGSTTYGAANNNKKIPIAPRFVLSVSYNRPVHPISGTNWEGVGVKPDIPVAGAAALDAAELDALDRLQAGANVPAERLAEYRWARVAIQARLHPVQVGAEQLEAMAGTYGTIVLKNSPAGLRFFRADRPKRPQGVLMTPLDGEGLFGIDGYDDLRARVTATGIVLFHGAPDQQEVFPRTGSSSL
ncbi:S41 family peptidase [Gemmatimonas aurantiaca]|uniref:S41 family peptidase n=1 Tax=Gemmatimonas aurantiaca TaxID=173480 RepID=UPI00301C458B